jgi:hypothetical protein
MANSFGWALETTAEGPFKLPARCGRVHLGSNFNPDLVDAVGKGTG